ncbi:MAG: PLP-dependent aminotransferase family protein [Oscillospiraceae bacterium]|nr:PLP-dependent aminotransferase family protein [Oscillospiraceae bacterium]
MEYKISEKMKDMKPSAIREIFKSLSDPEMIAFAAGNPAPESFPVKELNEISNYIFQNNAVTALQYSISEGYPALRESVKKRLNVKDTVIIVSGGQQGLELTNKVMCNPGDVVLCENPSFIGALNAYRSNGTIPVGVDIDEDGINIEKLEHALKTIPNVKLLYVIPNFQNPAGLTMSLEKRKAVYSLALKYGVIILEDNPYGELRFRGEDIPTIKSMDTEGIVVYCGSFSKILSAGMRVGFLCAPDELMQKIVVAKQVEDVHTNIFFQMVCERFMNHYDLEGHIQKVRGIYRAKCHNMLTALDKYMPKEVKYTRPDGGLFIWCTLPDSIPLNDFVQTALAQKVAVVPGTAFNCDETAPSQSFRITYSTPSPEQIERGVKIMSEIVGGFLR